jgi:hypothetical protein
MPPTAGPTLTLGNLATALALPPVSEYGGEVDVLRVNVDGFLDATGARVLLSGEVATVVCSTDDAATAQLIAPHDFTIDATGTTTPPAVGFVRARGVPDTTQLPRQSTTARCSISVAGTSRAAQEYAIEVRVTGQFQPSFKALCPLSNGTNPLGALTTCAVDATTNGDMALVVIGGDCAACPQPPFDDTTFVEIGGTRVATTLVPGSGGTRLLIHTPLISELSGGSGGGSGSGSGSGSGDGGGSGSGSAMPTHAPAKMPTDAPSGSGSGVGGGSGSGSATPTQAPTKATTEAPSGSGSGSEGGSGSESGSGSNSATPTQAPTKTPTKAPSGRRRLVPSSFGYYSFKITTPPLGDMLGGNVGVDATRGGASACAASGWCPANTFGIFYSDKCMGYPDQLTNPRWKDPEWMHIFAYGTPPNCRPCPVGCSCPGGNRCRSVGGYYTEGEDLGTKSGPTRCDAPALLRCPAVTGPGGTQCSEGYRGFACGTCETAWYRDRATCHKCEARGIVDAIIAPLAWSIAVALFLYPFLVGIKFVALFISDRVEKHGGGDDAPPLKPQKELLKIAALQTAKFLVHMAIAVQAIAVVNATAAMTVDSEVLRATHALLGIFLFNPPLLHPDCAEETIGIAADFVVESSLLVGALACFAAFVALMVHRLRPEQLCCGWRCCGDRIDAVRIVVHTHITPFLRYAIGCVLAVGYARYTKTALNVINCRASAALDGALALATDPTIACFTVEHSAAFVAALLALAVVGFAWPIVFTVSLGFQFAHRREFVDAAPSRWDLLCEPVADIIARRLKESERDEEKDGIVGANPDGRVEAEAGDDDAQGTGGSLVSDLLVELGCRCWQPRSAKLVRARVLAEGPRARAHATFLDTPFEPQYFWLIALRLFNTLLLNAANAFLVFTTPTFASALALFIITVCLMAVFTTVTVAPCPYHRSDRWNLALNICVFILTSLSAAVNLFISLHELGYGWAHGAVVVLANINAVALVLMFCGVFVAFLLSDSLGLCRRCGCACQHCDSTPTNHGVIIARDRQVQRPRRRSERRASTVSRKRGTSIEMQTLRVDDTARDSTVQQANPLVKRNQVRLRTHMAKMIHTDALSHGAAAALPAGWSVVRDVKSNTDYYANSQTGEKRWSLPHAVAPSSHGATLPEGWSVVRDVKSNTDFYANFKTGEKRWSFPHVVAPSSHGAALPEGWSALRDVNSNVDYYYNCETDETSWSAPLHAGWSAHTSADESTHYRHTPSGVWQSTVPTEEDTAAAVRIAMNFALPTDWCAVNTNSFGVHYANPVSDCAGRACVLRLQPTHNVPRPISSSSFQRR